MNINKELFYSITANNFSRLLSLLPYHFESIHELREYITREKIHFVRDFPVYFNKTKADVMITYDWRTGPIGLQNAIWSGLDYIGLHISESYPGVDVERIICHEISFWVDFLFIDQNKRNVEAELGELPKIIDSSSIHFVLSESALLRAWCCYEIALFNKRVAVNEAGMGQIVSFIAPTESGYSGWDYVKTSDPKEKIEIEKKIINNFPGGEIGFNNIMMQANLVAEKAFRDRATTQPFAAVQNLKNKITQWVK